MDYLYLMEPVSHMQDYSNIKDPYQDSRQEMVKQQIEARGVNDPLVIAAMQEVPRHMFVPAPYNIASYADSPLPIGEGQTISQPYIVAFMAQAAQLNSSSKLLEIGTGSGYNAAVLSRICEKVFTIEIIESLAQRAKETFGKLHYNNIIARAGDGYGGWPEEVPFDAIILTSAIPYVPPILISQLKEEGVLIAPLGKKPYQQLTRFTKKKSGLLEEALMPVTFVPMTGKVETRG